MHMPLVRLGQQLAPSWLSLAQVAGCTREMRTVISAVSWELVGDGCHAPRNVGTATCIFSQDPLQWQWSIPLNPYMAVVAQALPVQLMVAP